MTLNGNLDPNQGWVEWYVDRWWLASGLTHPGGLVSEADRIGEKRLKEGFRSRGDESVLGYSTLWLDFGIQVCNDDQSFGGLLSDRVFSNGVIKNMKVKQIDSGYTGILKKLE